MRIKVLHEAMMGRIKSHYLFSTSTQLNTDRNIITPEDGSPFYYLLFPSLLRETDAMRSFQSVGSQGPQPHNRRFNSGEGRWENIRRGTLVHIIFMNYHLIKLSTFQKFPRITTGVLINKSPKTVRDIGYETKERISCRLLL